MSPPPSTLLLWAGLRAWLAGCSAPSPALGDWRAELAELEAAWRSERRLEDLRGIELLRRALDLQLFPDGGLESVPALCPRRGSEPRAALEKLFGVPDLEALGELADARAPAPLRARVHDLRWLLLRDGDAADRAQAAYLELAAAADLNRPSQAQAAGEGLLRAVGLGRERQQREGVAVGMADMLPRALHAGPPIALHRFLQAALLARGPNRAALADLAISRAETELARRDFRWGRTFYGHASRALADSGRDNEAQTLEVVRASVLADEARFRRHLGEPEWVCASFYRRAVDELELIAGTAELIGDLRRDGRLDAGHPVGPLGIEEESGRFATVLEEVLGACDELDPLGRVRTLAALPLDCAVDLPGQRGPAVLDLFLKAFRARARGRFLPLAWHAPAPLPGDDAATGARVGAWIQSSRAWLVPVIEALRRHVQDGERERRTALERLFVDSSPEFAQRAEVLARGASACWEGDPLGGLGILVPQLATLRAGAAVHHLLERSPELALVDAALMHHPEGFALAAVVESGVAAKLRFSQVAADLVLWWTLCLAARVE